MTEDQPYPDKIISLVVFYKGGIGGGGYPTGTIFDARIKDNGNAHAHKDGRTWILGAYDRGVLWDELPTGRSWWV